MNELMVSNEHLYQKIKDIEKDIRKINRSIELSLQDIDWILPIMEEMNKDLVNECKREERELANIRDDLIMLGKPPKDFKQDLFPQSEEEENEEDRDDCKKLYREIAKKCHPDTLKDEKGLDDLFIEATKAYDKLDINKLSEITNKLKYGNVEVKEDKETLLNKIRLLQRELSLRARDLKEITGRLLYVIANNYKTKNPVKMLAGRKMFNDYMFNCIAKIIIEKEKLLKEKKRMERNLDKTK